MAGISLYIGGTEVDIGVYFVYKVSPGDSFVAHIIGDFPDILFGGGIFYPNSSLSASVVALKVIFPAEWQSRGFKAER